MMSHGTGSVSSAKLALIVMAKVSQSLGEADIHVNQSPTLIKTAFTRSIKSKGLINGYSQPLSLISGEDITLMGVSLTRML